MCICRRKRGEYPWKEWWTVEHSIIFTIFPISSSGRGLYFSALLIPDRPYNFPWPWNLRSEVCHCEQEFYSHLRILPFYLFLLPWEWYVLDKCCFLSLGPGVKNMCSSWFMKDMLWARIQPLLLEAIEISWPLVTAALPNLSWLI